MNEKPVRVQYSRKHKLVSPNGLPVVYVGRPTKWGNPLKLVGDMIYIDAGYRRKTLNKWVLQSDYVENLDNMLKIYTKIWTRKSKFIDFDLLYWQIQFKKLNLSELRGKNLACWCPLDKPCHADILLRLANS